MGSKAASLGGWCSQRLGGCRLRLSRRRTYPHRTVEQAHGTSPNACWVWDVERENVAMGRCSAMV